MKDVNGVELKVGDKVAYAKGTNSTTMIATGEITKFYQGPYGEECSVGRDSHVYSTRILKL